MNELEARDKIYKYFVEKYKLTKDKKENQRKLENNGYILEVQFLTNIEVVNSKG